MINRSWLFVPADDRDRLHKAASRGADALIIDLEDGVAPDRKAEARGNLRDFLSALTNVGQMWVRVSSDPDALEHDLEAALHENLAGLVLAKAESPDQLLDVAERLHRLPGAHRGLMPLIETAQAVVDMSALARCTGVTQLQIGEADLRADLGVTLGADESELLWVRQQAVVVSAAARVLPPVAPVSVEFRDLEAFRTGTERLARMGFLGRACIHPAQVAVAHEVFTPTPDEVAKAQELLRLADEAARDGLGVFVDADGRMVDEAILRSARRTLSLLGAVLGAEGGD